jgi:hypothetical protein
MDQGNSGTSSPGRLALRLAIYFFILFAAAIAVSQFWPDVFQYLPFGGRHALSGSTGSATGNLLEAVTRSPPPVPDTISLESIERMILLVAGHLTGTILLMVPITWTYAAINFDAGFRKNFVRALIILPICATTIVLLIQDSLALAFGLAALVAAVRFRVSLEDAIDGIFIFSAVCVGLAAGIGYLGAAMVMSLFFCFANVVMWVLGYGQNPVDEARVARKLAKQQNNPARTQADIEKQI